MLNEISQTEKDKYLGFHSYVESKTQYNWTNKTKQKQTYRYWEQTGGCQGVGGVGEMGEGD